MTRLSKVMVAILMMMSFNVFSDDTASIPAIHKQIIKNRPKLNENYVTSLKVAIHKSCIKYKIPCNVYTAILMQESKYILDSFNPDTKDHGISQINEKTAIAFGFDIHKLHTNLEYSVEAGAIVLADFRRMYGKKELDFWTRYNSSRPTQREIYKSLVAQFQ